MVGTSALHLVPNLCIRDGEEHFKLPEWARCLLWIGSWSRGIQAPGHRIVTVVLVPARGVCAALIALGALMEGCRTFSKELSWPRFRDLPAGTIVYWRPPDAGRQYKGRLLPLREMNGQELITVEIVRGARGADCGATLGVPEREFEKYGFRLEAPAQGRRMESSTRAVRAYEELVGAQAGAWLAEDGADVLLISRMSEFRSSLEGLGLVPAHGEAIDFGDLLIPGGGGNNSRGRLRLTHARSDPSLDCPLALLEGLEAFDAKDHVRARNLLFLFERAEYSAAVSNWVAAVRAQAKELPPSMLEKYPGSVPPGIEMVSYLVLP